MAARIVGTWELYLLAFAFLAALVVTWLQVRSLRGRLEVTRTVTPRQPFAGDPLQVSFRVRSGSRVPGQQVTLLDACGELGCGDQAIHIESLGSQGERVATSGPWPARRGIHHLPGLAAIAEDPLGLVRAQTSQGPLDVLVPPRLALLGSCALISDGEVGGNAGRRLPTLRGSEFRGIRPHSPGEPLNRVDWKATAKTGSLMLRETEDATDGDVTLLLNAAPSHVVGELPETNFELAVQAAGSIVDYALRTGHAATLLVPGHEWRPIRLAPDADGHLRLLEVLAAASPRGLPRMGPSLRTLVAGGRLRATRMLILVVLALDDGLVHALIALRREGLHTSVVHIDAGSFVPADTTAERASLRLALSAAGIGYLPLERGADLQAALSMPAGVRHGHAR